MVGASTTTAIKNKAAGMAAAARRDISRTKRGADSAMDWDEDSATDSPQSEYQIMQAIQAIGGAVIAIAIVTIVVNAVLTTDAVANSSGPFSGVITSLETTGVSAMVLLVIGLLVAAATRLMSMFKGGF